MGILVGEVAEEGAGAGAIVEVEEAVVRGKQVVHTQRRDEAGEGSSGGGVGGPEEEEGGQKLEDAEGGSCQA